MGSKRMLISLLGFAVTFTLAEYLENRISFLQRCFVYCHKLVNPIWVHLPHITQLCGLCCLEETPAELYYSNSLPPVTAVCLLVSCLTSQQHASASQGRICSDNFTYCHTEIEVADPTFHLTQSQYTDTGPTSPSNDPIPLGA